MFFPGLPASQMATSRNVKPKNGKSLPMLNRTYAPREKPESYRLGGDGKHRKLHCIDLFAGCGGLSLGLEDAGFTTVLFSELNRQAADTYLANREEMEIIEESDIYKLTNQKLEKHLQNLKRRGIKVIDLVCGGPPCQGFSGIGHRRTFRLDKKDIPSNHLFLEMVRVIKKVKPKIFLFENVKGLLNSRWTPDGEKGEIWRAVLTAFRKIPGYTVRWELVHAKNYGVPQNRPRVLMVGIRKDVLNASRKKGIISHSEDRFSAIQSGFLPIGSNDAPSLEDLLSDLEDPEFEGKDCNPAYLKDPQSKIQIHLRTTREGKRMKKGSAVTEHEYSQHAEYIREKFAHMIKHDGEIPAKFQTKKFAQRVFPKKWGAGGPNITATSLPEDYVHYREPRSPTVREWARLQTFPDWYVFKGPRTTGGRRRAGDPSKNIWDRDVPRYTQIGNAVPVLLAKKIGVHLSKILAG
jgi:DNA (cytosine-5)-methyltransferase 1